MKNTIGLLAVLVLFFSGCSSNTESRFEDQDMPVHQVGKVLKSSTASPSDPTSSATQMTKAAVDLIASLSEKDRADAMYSLNDDTVRTNWSNLPAAMVARDGVRVGDLSDEQRVLLHDLIRASTSSQGYLKIAGIMWLDDILSEQSRDRIEQSRNPDFMARLVESWSSKNYWFAFFGMPGEDEQWAWAFTGHHLAANFTVADDQVGFTPLFLGAEPYEVQKGPFAGWRVLSHEVERGFELVQSLDADQKTQTVLASDVPRDVLEGPGRKNSLKSFEGISANLMNKRQQAILWRLVQEYIRNADHDAADAQLDKIKNDGNDKLFFSWMGPTDDINKRYYYRVHGPSVLIEYVRERAVGGQPGAANHVHSIVRDPNNDYGEDWLEKHYQEHHREGR